MWGQQGRAATSLIVTTPSECASVSRHEVVLEVFPPQGRTMVPGEEESWERRVLPRRNVSSEAFFSFQQGGLGCNVKVRIPEQMPETWMANTSLCAGASLGDNFGPTTGRGDRAKSIRYQEHPSRGIWEDRLAKSWEA